MSVEVAYAQYLEDLEDQAIQRRAVATCGSAYPADPPGPDTLGTTCSRHPGHPPFHRVRIGNQIVEWA